MELQENDVLYAGGASKGQGMPQAEPVQGGGFTFSGEGGNGFRQFVEFKGSGWALFKICIVNFLLTIITLGIYHFWAKVRVRKYLWSHTVVEGEPLEYTGTGKELFFGFLIVAGVFILYMVLQMVLERIHPGLSVLAALLLMPFWFFATYRAVRYRLTRTRWRGIRFNLSGSAWKYMFLALGQSLLNLITLSLWYPKSCAVLRKRIIGNIWYGNRNFTFSGKAAPLYVSYLVAVLAIIGFGVAGFMLADLPTAFQQMNSNPGPEGFKSLAIAMGTFYGMLILGVLVSQWFMCVFIRWEVGNTGFPGVRFRSSLTFGRYFWVQVSNLFLVLLTVGIASPWAAVRSLKLYLNTLDADGCLDYAHLAQDAQEAPKFGEGFLEAFDVDLAV